MPTSDSEELPSSAPAGDLVPLPAAESESNEEEMGATPTSEVTMRISLLGKLIIPPPPRP